MLTVILLLASSLCARGDRRYLANITLVGRSVQCSEKEKLCFRYNQVYEPSSDRCYNVPDVGPCNEGQYVLDRRAWNGGKGKIRGVCGVEKQCPPNQYFMAYDLKCYNDKDIKFNICKENRGYSHMDIFGRFDCGCVGNNCVPRKLVQQPKDVGRCLFPNFRDEQYHDLKDSVTSFHLPCSKGQGNCFRQNMALFEGNGKCYELLKRGPCPNKEILVFDKMKILAGIVAVKCQKAQRCSKGRILMSCANRCELITTIKNFLHVTFHMDAYGDYICAPDYITGMGFFLGHKNGICSMTITMVAPSVSYIGKMCSDSNSGECPKYVELKPNDPPMFD